MERLPQILDHPPARQDESASWEGSSPGVLPALPVPGPVPASDLADVTTRELRLLCNRTFQQLDTEHPALETRERYSTLTEELQRRELEAGRHGPGEAVRESFRDNALFSRFELFRNGVMVGYVQYDMRGGYVLLLHSVMDPRCRRDGLESVLMQAVLLNAHRRRLAVMPYCPGARGFLAAHPQFLSLIPARQRRRFVQSMTPGARAAPEVGA